MWNLCLPGAILKIVKNNCSGKADKQQGANKGNNVYNCQGPFF